jgi:surfeit locus 1 family protein
MLGFRPRLWPTIIAVPIVLTCLGLGAWQVQRMEWKRGLIAEREAALALLRPLRRAYPRRGATDGVPPVTEEGVFLHDKEIFVGASAGSGRIGYHVLTPLREADGRVVFVNRGFIPSQLKDPATRAAGQITGTVRVTACYACRPRASRAGFCPTTGRTRITGSGGPAGDERRNGARRCCAVLHRR